ncbi:MAG: ABC transporter ATP-binding protein [Clostridia bacterium]|nr:ABC transporter ATP-binding protein [Clostridia bacterium]
MRLLELKNISKTYGSKKNKKYTALKNISFDVESGDFMGIMGASGSGKTTLLNIIGSIDMQTSGSVVVNGIDVSDLSKKQLAAHRRENIGFIFQDYNLLDSMTIEENIVLPLALSGEKAKVIKDKLNALADDLKIKDILPKFPYEVSGGEKQRASACRALITEPKIILADEPTGNLDTASGKQLLNMLEYINQNYKTTILMVTHDIFAASYCHNILFIKDGEIYNHLHSKGDRQEFFNSILNVMSALGGTEK